MPIIEVPPPGMKPVYLCVHKTTLAGVGVVLLKSDEEFTELSAALQHLAVNPGQYILPVIKYTVT